MESYLQQHDTQGEPHAAAKKPARNGAEGSPSRAKRVGRKLARDWVAILVAAVAILALVYWGWFRSPESSPNRGAVAGPGPRAAGAPERSSALGEETKGTAGAGGSSFFRRQEAGYSRNRDRWGAVRRGYGRGRGAGRRGGLGRGRGGRGRGLGRGFRGGGMRNCGRGRGLPPCGWGQGTEPSAGPGDGQSRIEPSDDERKERGRGSWPLIHAAPSDLLAPFELRASERRQAGTTGAGQAEPLLRQLALTWQRLEVGFAHKADWDHLEQLHLELFHLEEKLQTLVGDSLTATGEVSQHSI